MTKTAKIPLAILLILSLAILPMRMAFAMPIGEFADSTGSHCASMNMKMDHSKMKHDSSDKEDSKQTSNSSCCNQDNGNCSGCVHITAAFDNDTPLFINQLVQIEKTFFLTTLHSRTPPGLYKPPQTLYI